MDSDSMILSRYMRRSYFGYNFRLCNYRQVNCSFIWKNILRNKNSWQRTMLAKPRIKIHKLNKMGKALYRISHVDNNIIIYSLDT